MGQLDTCPWTPAMYVVASGTWCHLSPILFPFHPPSNSSNSYPSFRDKGPCGGGESPIKKKLHVFSKSPDQSLAVQYVGEYLLLALQQC